MSYCLCPHRESASFQAFDIPCSSCSNDELQTANYSEHLLLAIKTLGYSHGLTGLLHSILVQRTGSPAPKQILATTSFQDTTLSNTMVSIWGSNRNEQRTTEEGQGQTQPQPQYEQREPDERTRLIHRAAPNEGYLSPDDPAVRLSLCSSSAGFLANGL